MCRHLSRAGFFASLVVGWSSLALAQKQQPSERAPNNERPAAKEQPASKARLVSDEAPLNAPLAKPRGAAAAPAAPLTAPFQLSAAEQRFLDKVLEAWEKSSEKVKTFKCDFHRWDYDKTYGPKEKGYLRAEGDGMLKYKRPDRGEYYLSDMNEWNPATTKYESKADARERWVCDGQSIFQYEFAKKELVENKLPPELQGAAIADGPVPFVFGAKADQLRKRYFLRDITPPDKAKDYIWLEALPRFQQDAANFERVWVMLTAQDFQPYALQVFLPGGTKRSAYEFKNIKINDAFSWLKADFVRPSTKLMPGWKTVLDPGPTPPKDNPPPAANASEARRAPVSQRSK